ncbi:glycosyltransferase [Granulicoccus sp. GXG6511]|uniref:glycosyltransferase n=1 Tax=Granulicoccus sp. GXG6511 TaxID=3381351 RepID=UPI003D7D91F7
MTSNESQRPINVLWLIKGLGPGGAEQLLVSSARVADHERFHFEVAFVRADKTQLVPALEESGVTAHRLTAGGNPRLWPLRLRRLMGRFDVIHAHSPLLAGVARVLSRTFPRSQRPVLLSTEHNMWSRFERPTRWLNGVTAPLDARRWAVSEEVVRSMWPSRAKGAEVLIHGIVQGANPPSADARQRVRAELGITEDAVVSLTLANLRKQKDYPNLLRAAKKAFAQNPDLVMLAAGQGPLMDEMTALHKELEAGDRFRFLGYRSDISDLLSAADIFTLSSEHEGLPVSIMEAMDAGLPVVATTVGGVPEAVADGVSGILVPPHDHERLASAILKLADDPDLRASMGAEGRSRAPRFDIRTAVTAQQDAYAAVAR